VYNKACGTCFDFNDKQEDLYIIGTEEGKLYEVSKNHTNKILTVFEGHKMPVYAVKWNLYFKKVFLTCSSDWSVKIWEHTYRDPIFTFDLGEVVSDVAWSPYSSTVFAAITSNGYIYIYDLAVDLYDPLCVQNVFGSTNNNSTTKQRKRILTHVTFNNIYPIILVSDNKGSVYSFKISPNLRSIPKDNAKNAKLSVINKGVFEFNKIKRLIEQELNLDNAQVETTRKKFNFEERKFKVKANQDYDQDEEREQKFKNKYLASKKAAPEEQE
jgi:dynein intermediate chain 1